MTALVLVDVGAYLTDGRTLAYVIVAEPDKLTCENARDPIGVRNRPPALLVVHPDQVGGAWRVVEREPIEDGG